VDVLLSFAAALVSLRLAGRLLKARRVAWGAGLLSFAAAAGAMAWGSAHGWDDPSFRVYYLAGALLSAPLLGIGSLQLNGRRWAAPLGLLYVGLAIGVAAAMPLHGTFSSTDVPRAQDHVDVFPRVLAIAGSSLGALAVVYVAAATLRRRPLRNVLLVAAVAAAALASALTQTAVAAAAAGFALAAGLLYASARR
jgi:dipeptide/tripeptide permease